jgi:hypothetical protein
MRAKATFSALFCVALLVTEAFADEPLVREFSRKSHVTLKVDDGKRAIAELRALASELGGRTVGELDPSRVVTLEVPNERYPELSRRLNRVGIVQNEKLNQKNVTQDIESALELARTAKAREEHLERLRQNARNTGEAVELERELERATEERTRAEGRVRELRRGTGTTLVDVTLVLPPREEIVDPSLPIPWLNEVGLEFLQSPTEPHRDWELRAFIDPALELRGGYLPDLEGRNVYGMIALPFRALGEANPIGLFGGFDLAFGLGSEGFGYNVLFLGGVGVPIGESFAFGVSTGPGIDSLMGGVVPFGVSVPIELHLSFEAIRFLGISAYVRDGWVFASEERKKGAEHAPFGDELSAGIRFTVARRSGSGYTQHRWGWRFGFDYRETTDLEVYQLVIGVGAMDSDYSF